MLGQIFSIIFGNRLDRMTAAEIQQACEEGTLTFHECKRLAAYQNYTQASR